MAKLNYKDIVPRNTFIGQYMDYMSSVETAYDYDFWCAVWLMSLALGRDVIVARPRAKVYMNWYIILVAESGVTRKSTGVRAAQRIALSFIERSPSEISLIQNKSTPEGLELLLQRMSNEHGYAHAAISIDEMVRFLGRERYAMELPGLLTDLYDAPEFRTGGGTVSRGPVVLRNVYLSFISASTPSWLGRAINPDIIEGGFTSRTVFVCSEKRKRKVSWPM